MNDTLSQPDQSPLDQSPDQLKPASTGVEEARRKTHELEPDEERLNDDDRDRFSWRSRYEDSARRRITLEAWYVVGVIVASIVCIFLTWHGGVLAALSSGCLGCHPESLRGYSYVFFGGVLGGGLFGLKYLYKVVARGWWNQDRAIWRFASPLLSGGLAFAAGVMAQAGIFGFATRDQNSGASFVALGFIVGYFADDASRKMQQIAKTIFGRPGTDVDGAHPKKIEHRSRSAADQGNNN